MIWQYNTVIKWKSKETPLRYNIEDRTATYLFQGKKFWCNINPRTPYDDILIDIAERFLEKY
jgi:hypothetical protein